MSKRDAAVFLDICMHRKLFGRNLGINDHCLFRFGCLCLYNYFKISQFV